MARHIEDEVIYYYDLHPIEEDEMGESVDHATLVRYLMGILLWLFHGYPCAIYENLNFYQTALYREKPLAPDIAVIKGVELQRVRSWRVGKHGPAPQVVFEIASAETWEADLIEKPAKYARMGVQEYFAYDPNEPPVFKDKPGRLLGWRLDPLSQEMRALPLRPDGSLWSRELESLLVPDGPFLRLEDQYGQRRLTKAEAEEQRAEAEAAARQVAERQAEAEKRRAETETAARQMAEQLAEVEKRRADAEAEAKEAEKRRADAEAKRAEELAEKLRSLGIDPNLL